MFTIQMFIKFGLNYAKFLYQITQVFKDNVSANFITDLSKIYLNWKLEVLINLLKRLEPTQLCGSIRKDIRMRETYLHENSLAKE